MEPFSPDDIYNELEKRSNEFESADNLYRDLKSSEEPLLSEIILEYMTKYTDENVTLWKVRAKADKRYKTHMAGMMEAKHLSNNAKLKFDNYKEKCRLMQTDQANRRGR